MGCELGIECACGSAVLSGSVLKDSKTYIPAVEKIKIDGEWWETVKGPGQMKLTGSDDLVEGHVCGCTFDGSVKFYYKPDNDPVVYDDFINMNLEVTIVGHDLAIARVTSDADNYSGVVTSTPLHRHVVEWKYKAYCPDFVPPTSTSGSGWDAFPDIVSMELADETRPACDPLTLLVQGDWACKKQCVVTGEYDWKGISHLTTCYADETRYTCPQTAMVDWPWFANYSDKLEDNVYWRQNDTHPDANNNYVYEYQYTHGIPLYDESDLPGCCDLNLCGVMKGTIHYRGAWMRPQDWWEVNDGSWSTTRPQVTDIPSGKKPYCFEWCHIKYYKIYDENGLPVEEKPRLNWVIPCSLANDHYHIYMVNNDGTEQEITSLTGYAGSKIDGGDNSDHLRITIDMPAFEKDPSTGEYICDETTGIPNTVTEEVLCADSITSGVPDVDMSSGDDCMDVWYCVKKESACSDNQCSMDLTISWADSSVLCMDMGNVWNGDPKTWHNGETRTICSSGWVQTAPGCYHSNSIITSSRSVTADAVSGSERICFLANGYDCAPHNTCFNFGAVRGGYKTIWGDGHGGNRWTSTSGMVTGYVKWDQAADGGQFLTYIYGLGGEECFQGGRTQSGRTTMNGLIHNSGRAAFHGQFVGNIAGSVSGNKPGYTLTMKWDNFKRGTNPPVANP